MLGSVYGSTKSNSGEIEAVGGRAVYLTSTLSPTNYVYTQLICKANTF